MADESGGRKKGGDKTQVGGISGDMMTGCKWWNLMIKEDGEISLELEGRKKWREN